MDKLKGEAGTLKGNKEWMVAIAQTQQQGLDELEQILEELLHRGMLLVEGCFEEEVIGDTEDLVDRHMPNILRELRHLSHYLIYSDVPKKHPAAVVHINYLLVLLDEAKRYLQERISGGEVDVNSVIEASIGRLWRNHDLIKYNLYEEGTEIVQLAFISTKNLNRRVYIDKAYWLNLKSREIQYTCKHRPMSVAKFITKNNTETAVLKANRLYTYPGKINRRIRWGKIEKREITSNEIATIHECAKADYSEVVRAIKESFREPLCERNPAILIKLHRAFINGDHLVLEDEKGAFLTVMDMPGDNMPTSELLQTILPAHPVGCTLLVQVNDDVDMDLFSVKPLSVITPDRIIRLLY